MQPIIDISTLDSGAVVHHSAFGFARIVGTTSKGVKLDWDSEDPNLKQLPLIKGGSNMQHVNHNHNHASQVSDPHSLSNGGGSTIQGQEPRGNNGQKHGSPSKKNSNSLNNSKYTGNFSPSQTFFKGK